MKRLAIIALTLGLVACMGGTSPTAPSITVQPKSLVVVANTTASFSVEVLGSAPLVYRWQKNGVDIAGANSKTYSQQAALGDSGSLFQVNISNSAGQAWSCIATLAVVTSGSASSSEPTCISLTPPGGSSPLPTPTPPSPSPPSPPAPPTPPTPPSPPVPPPPPNPGEPWKVPLAKWNATFKVTAQDTDPANKGQSVVEGTAVFVSDHQKGARDIFSQSGQYTVDGSFAHTSGCKLETTHGSGTIGPSEGQVIFTPDDMFIPIHLTYQGLGTSVGGGTTTTTYSNCSPGSTPPPSTGPSGALWLFISGTPLPTTSPDLHSFSGQYKDTEGTVTITYEWSFVRVN